MIQIEFNETEALLTANDMLLAARTSAKENFLAMAAFQASIALRLYNAARSVSAQIALNMIECREIIDKGNKCLLR